MRGWGQNTRQQKETNRRDFKASVIFCFREILIQNKRPGFVPDRYLQKSTVVVAEEIQKMGQFFAYATVFTVKGNSHVA
jgi:hypothetical protein